MATPPRLPAGTGPSGKLSVRILWEPAALTTTTPNPSVGRVLVGVQSGATWPSAETRPHPCPFSWSAGTRRWLLSRLWDSWAATLSSLCPDTLSLGRPQPVPPHMVLHGPGKTRYFLCVCRPGLWGWDLTQLPRTFSKSSGDPVSSAFRHSWCLQSWETRKPPPPGGALLRQRPPGLS